MSAVKTWGLNVCLLFISGGLSVLLLEGLVRIMFPVYNPSGMVAFYHNETGVLIGKKNSVTHQWMKAGDFNVEIRINQYGFRDTKDLQRSTASDFFVVGDSFSFGHGVAEAKRYSNLLEAWLGIPVYNISIPTDFDGYEKLIKYAQANGATIKNLIIGVCMENDLENYAIASSADPGKTVQRETEASSYYNKINMGTFFRVKVFLGKTFAIYNVVISLFHQNPMLKALAGKFGIMDRYPDGINRTVYSEEILKKSSARLRQLQSNCQIPTITLVIIPSRALWIGEHRAIELKVHQDFVRLLRNQGFNVIDLRPAFEEGGEPLQYHFENDGHWNEKGHLKAAEIIFVYLRATRQNSH